MITLRIIEQGLGDEVLAGIFAVRRLHRFGHIGLWKIVLVDMTRAPLGVISL
jgi:hypothetical protein